MMPKTPAKKERKLQTGLCNFTELYKVMSPFSPFIFLSQHTYALILKQNL